MHDLRLVLCQLRGTQHASSRARAARTRPAGPHGRLHPGGKELHRSLAMSGRLTNTASMSARGKVSRSMRACRDVSTPASSASVRNRSARPDVWIGTVTNWWTKVTAAFRRFAWAGESAPFSTSGRCRPRGVEAHLHQLAQQVCRELAPGVQDMMIMGRLPPKVTVYFA